jgi:hypothetical protein
LTGDPVSFAERRRRAFRHHAVLWAGGNKSSPGKQIAVRNDTALFTGKRESRWFTASSQATTSLPRSAIWSAAGPNG